MSCGCIQHRRLAGMEGVGLCPAETEAQAKVAMFGCLLLRTRIIGHIQPGMQLHRLLG